jgi:hypothetical protein
MKYLLLVLLLGPLAALHAADLTLTSPRDFQVVQRATPARGMLKHSHFFEPLHEKYIDSAFLDRIHSYNPGWEVAVIRHELFTEGYGIVVLLSCC